MRSEASAAKVRAAYPNVRVVLGSLDDAELLTKEASWADLVLREFFFSIHPQPLPYLLLVFYFFFFELVFSLVLLEVEKVLDIVHQTLRGDGGRSITGAQQNAREERWRVALPDINHRVSKRSTAN